MLVASGSVVRSWSSDRSEWGGGGCSGGVGEGGSGWPVTGSLWWAALVGFTRVGLSLSFGPHGGSRNVWIGTG